MIGVIFVDSFDDGIDYTISVDGKPFRFTFSDRFGPLALNKDGTERKREWSRRTWDCVQAWIDQGKKHDGGMCIYKAPGDEG